MCRNCKEGGVIAQETKGAQEGQQVTRRGQRKHNKIGSARGRHHPFPETNRDGLCTQVLVAKMPKASQLSYWLC